MYHTGYEKKLIRAGGRKRPRAGVQVQATHWFGLLLALRRLGAGSTGADCPASAAAAARFALLATCWSDLRHSLSVLLAVAAVFRRVSTSSLEKGRVSGASPVFSFLASTFSQAVFQLCSKAWDSFSNPRVASSSPGFVLARRSSVCSQLLVTGVKTLAARPRFSCCS